MEDTKQILHDLIEKLDNSQIRYLIVFIQKRFGI